MMRSRVEFDPAPSQASREIVGPSEARRTITFFPPSVGTVWISSEVMVLPDQGIPLTAGRSPITFTVDLHGEVVTRGWFGLYDINVKPVSWIQGLA